MSKTPDKHKDRDHKLYMESTTSMGFVRVEVRKDKFGNYLIYGDENLKMVRDLINDLLEEIEYE